MAPPASFSDERFMKLVFIMVKTPPDSAAIAPPKLYELKLMNLELLIVALALLR